MSSWLTTKRKKCLLALDIILVQTQTGKQLITRELIIKHIDPNFTVSVNVIPYGKQEITQQDIDSVIEVLQSDFLTQGPKVPEFENLLRTYTKPHTCGGKQCNVSITYRLSSIR